MHLNTIKPNPKSKFSHKRVGRGIGSGLGKTAGRGHKGQKARAGGYHKLGFEGGQMPLQRRIPKSGFSSRVGRTTDEVRLHELNSLDGTVIDMLTLRKAGLINGQTKRVKIIASGKLTKALTIGGDVQVTAGAKTAIEAAGGKVAAA